MWPFEINIHYNENIQQNKILRAAIGMEVVYITTNQS